jgi:arylsulfatase A-like enzyme
MDVELRQLFDKLEALGLFENSLIIITSDHGEAFGESSILFHGTSVYQHQVHVPLIVKYPRSSAASTVTSLVSSVDLLPTILDVIGAPIPPDVEERSLRQDSSVSRIIISESYRTRGQGFTSLDGGPDEIAFFSGSFKEILGADGAVELYDLANDPRETTNLYGRETRFADLRTTMVAYMNQDRSHSSTSPMLDREEVKRLRALGYMQ